MITQIKKKPRPKNTSGATPTTPRRVSNPRPKNPSGATPTTPRRVSNKKKRAR